MDEVEAQGRARHSVRAVPQDFQLLARSRRAEDCAPYLATGSPFPFRVVRVFRG